MWDKSAGRGEELTRREGDVVRSAARRSEGGCCCVVLGAGAVRKRPLLPETRSPPQEMKGDLTRPELVKALEEKPLVRVSKKSKPLTWGIN